MADKVEPSDLRTHKRHRWGLQAAINAGLGDNLRFNSWFVERLPECLWWDAVMTSKESAGVEATQALLDVMNDAIGDNQHPPLGIISDFGRVPAEKREAVRALYARHFPDLREFHGAMALFKDHPMAWAIEGLDTIDAKAAEEHLNKRIRDLWQRRGRAGVDSQMLVIGEMARRGKLYLPAESETIKIFTEYPNGDLDLAGRMVNSTMSAMYSMAVLRSTWAADFWAQNKTRTPCTLPMEDHNDVHRTILKKEMEALLTGAAIPHLRSALIILTQAALRAREDQDKTEALLGLLSHCTRIVEDVASHTHLREPPWAHYAMRAVSEHTVVALYLLKSDPAVAVKYKEYGRGRQKLHQKLLQDAVALAPPEKEEELSKLLENARGKVGLEKMEEFVDVRWDNWVGNTGRERARNVGREDVYKLVTAPNSDVVHAAWNIVREYDMSLCLTPSHGGHVVPRRNYIRVSGTILGTFADLVWEVMFEAAKKWACEDELNELLGIEPGSAETPPGKEQ